MSIQSNFSLKKIYQMTIWLQLLLLMIAFNSCDPNGVLTLKGTSKSQLPLASSSDSQANTPLPEDAAPAPEEATSVPEEPPQVVVVEEPPQVVVVEEPPQVVVVEEPKPITLVGLKASFSLDENSGNTFSNDLDATHLGNLIGGPEWITGVAGSGLRFNGSNHGKIPLTSELRGISKAITVSLWMKRLVRKPKLQFAVARQRGSTGFDQFVLGYNNDQIAFGLGTINNYQMIFGPNNVTNTQWIHVLGSYNGTQVKLYINGSLQASANLSGTLADDGNPIYLGTETNNGTSLLNYFNGDIDNLMIYDRALTDSEITDLYNSQAVKL